MQTPFLPTIPASSSARLSTRKSQPSAGRSIAREGITVTGRVSTVLQSSALGLLLIAILAD